MRSSTPIRRLICVLVCASDFTSLRGQTAAGQSAGTVTDTQKQSRLPFDISGYLSLRQQQDEEPGSRSSFREYAASVFFSKSIRKWGFHSELNVEKAPHFDEDGLLFGPKKLKSHLHTGWVNYAFRDSFQARAGFLFVPTYWRTHRYQSLTLTVEDPLIDRRIFPTGISGGMAHGSWFSAAGGISYTVFGGVVPRRPAPAEEMQLGEGGVREEAEHGDEREYEKGRPTSQGGTFLVHVPTAHTFKTMDFGVQYLRQSYSDGKRQNIYGLESRIESGRVSLLAEFAHASVNLESGRSLYFKEGLYVQPSYRLHPKLFAVYRYDVLNADSRMEEGSFRR
ncbi:MAG: hypothetical protein EXQ52_06090 [Bryobacterales bacterium]|nr:hypothetical protein [Bryobacterales bacterium]